MSSSAERTAARTAGRAARRSLQGAPRVQAERALLTHLRSVHAVQTSANAGVFVAHDGEPDLFPLVTELWGRGQGISLPVVGDDPGDYSMKFVPWLAKDDLVAGCYGIPIPPRDNVIEPDVLLVSLTGFDQFGNRIGRGAGYFDRYLSQFAGLAIGVGFEVQRIDRVPVQDHDISLRVMVTDLGVRFV